MSTLLDGFMSLVIVILFLFILGIVVSFKNAAPLDINKTALSYKNSNPEVCKLTNFHNTSGDVYSFYFLKKYNNYKKLKLNQNIFNHIDIVTAINDACIRKPDYFEKKQSLPERVGAHLREYVFKSSDFFKQKNTKALLVSDFENLYLFIQQTNNPIKVSLALD